MSGQIPSTKRPKAGEDEDELLRQMQEFEASKSSIATENIVSFQKNKKPLSKFAQQRKATGTTAGQEAKPEQRKQENVLKSVIQEREFDSEQFAAQMMKIQQETSGATAFPSVLKLDKVISSEKGQSLFSRQTAQSSEENCPCCIQFDSKVVVSSNSFQRDWSQIASTSRLNESAIVKDNEKKEIHESNIAILDAMSDEQLRQERQELLDKLDPEVVEMLMHKRKRAPKRHSDEMDANVEEKKTVPDMKSGILNNSNKNYLNMKNYEDDKMEWMNDVKEKDDDHPINFSAR